MFRTARRKPLSPLEHDIMDFVWTRKSATADQVREALAPSRPLKDSTVRTVLRRLEEKGYLTHAVDARTFLYRAVEAPQRVAAGAVRQIVDRFFGGSVEQLLVGMVEGELVDRGELQRLAQKISRARKENKS
jgi:BlaI family transcriptional regulator, penicillinase repressor